MIRLVERVQGPLSRPYIGCFADVHTYTHVSFQGMAKLKQKASTIEVHMHVTVLGFESLHIVLAKRDLDRSN